MFCEKLHEKYTFCLVSVTTPNIRHSGWNSKCILANSTLRMCNFNSTKITMLVSIIRRSVPYNLRRVAACVISRNKTKTKVARYNNESNLLSTSLPHLAACRIYSTKRDSESRVTLPTLVEAAPMAIPSFITPLKLIYLSAFKITPYIDKEFNAAEFLQGAKCASEVISKALASKNFESLEGLVAEDMIEILREKIETLSPNERQLIELNKNDILFYVLSDIAATTGNEHSIEITTTCHYIPGFGKAKKEKMFRTGFAELTEHAHLVCNYTFTRKYVNNIGGPWIATLVNHFTLS
ncbi:PREDICTED: uncharacterized protein C2orf47, mitochondrial-like [Dinoponera quadriceps]|uniref:Uncharacterized protein C2orf47, mitochondrial-like n=1 Tax=Dinoponera quadriceps TaxID=609295 RepID=A0A6P3XF31_DINQU|nr:PREDICTED: uncharacterized protein C2orf47, mitochondrial-like [Dinoponera quadriceps]